MQEQLSKLIVLFYLFSYLLRTYLCQTYPDHVTKVVQTILSCADRQHNLTLNMCTHIHIHTHIQIVATQCVSYVPKTVDEPVRTHLMKCLRNFKICKHAHCAQILKKQIKKNYKVILRKKSSFHKDFSSRIGLIVLNSHQANGVAWASRVSFAAIIEVNSELL